MFRSRNQTPNPSAAEVRRAQVRFKEYAPRALFYRAADELVGSAIRGKSQLNLAEAINVLLQSWNRRYYLTRRPTEQDYTNLEDVIERYAEELTGFRRRRIETFRHADKEFTLVNPATAPDLAKIFS